MSARVDAVKMVSRPSKKKMEEQPPHSEQFGARVFSHRMMELVLSKKIYQNILSASEGKEKLDPANADEIASAIKDWAVKLGATHFTHWFQPLTGASAEKHDSFLSWSGKGTVIEIFKGSDLLRGEPDASSFPTGGLRSTHEARGYTVWDPASNPFLWNGANGLTLCIPSLFFSWTALALDHKIPLLRSDEKLNAAVLRLLKSCEIAAGRIFSTVGIEQEYFLIDRNFYLQRPDLLLCDRTVFGAKPAKGQELEDHYFGPVKNRVMAFMREFEEEAILLGIPIRTRHNEVAPAQHEVAPLFEPASIATDHNLILMELMRQIALDHNLACIMHEKPFATLNGSGKHANWSLATDTGLNLLDPRENSFLFLTLITAILRGIQTGAGLMRASIASAGNDLRLGGAEAPPTILSVYLGEKLESIIDSLLEEKSPPANLMRGIDLGLSHVPIHEADASDRNRTSFFAFTGSKFEFRAVGASAHPSFPITVINAIVADSLNLILDEIADVVKDRKLTQDELLIEALPCLRKHLQIAKPILFNGNAYSVEWEKEAERRGLPNIRKSFHAFSQIIDTKAVRVFDGILSEKELISRYNVMVERYCKTIQIEANLMIEMFRTQVMPSGLQDLHKRAQAIKTLIDLGIGAKTEHISHFAKAIDDAGLAIDAVEKVLRQSVDFGWEAKAKAIAELLLPKMEEARCAVDLLETLVDNSLWPLPKYREMLFIL